METVAYKLPLQKQFLKTVQVGFIFDLLFIDIFGPLSPSSTEDKSILSMKDGFSKWVILAPIKNSTTLEIVKTIESRLFVVYGFPIQIHSDRGSNLTAQMLKDIYVALGTRGSQTPAYNPVGNQIEDTHKLIGRMLKALLQENKEESWVDLIPRINLALSASRNTSIKITPYYAMFGRHPNLELQVIVGSTPDHLISLGEYASNLFHRLERTYKYIRSNLKRDVEIRERYYGLEDYNKFVEGALVWLFTPTKKLESLQSCSFLVPVLGSLKKAIRYALPYTFYAMVK